MKIDELTEQLSSIAKKAITETVQQTLKKRGEDIASAVSTFGLRLALAAYGNLVTDVSVACLNAILGNKSELKSVERTLAKLVREPFETGVERLRIASSLPSTTADQATYRYKRLQDALESFDRANSLADAAERPIVNLMRGLITLQIPGAVHEAQLHLSAFAEYCDISAAELNDQALDLDTRALHEEEEAAGISANYTPGLGGGFIGMEKAAPLIRKSGLLQNAKQLKASARLLRSRAADFIYMSDSCTEICSVINRK